MASHVLAVLGNICLLAPLIRDVYHLNILYMRRHQLNAMTH